MVSMTIVLADRVLFTVTEPWSESYREGQQNLEFMELHHQLEIVLRDLFAQYGQSDDDSDIIKTTLLNVS